MQTESKNQAQAAIAAHVLCLVDQLQAGKSEALTAYLTAMSRFHRYSFGSVLAIAAQRPNSIRVAGFQAWKKLGRNVKKGEKGIRILAPVTRKCMEDDEGQRLRLAGFHSADVFDISQTEGKELAELDDRVTGDVGANRDRLFAFIAARGIELSFSESIAPALGMSYGGRIALLPGQTKAEEFATAVHETAHELLHRTERRSQTTKVIRETEAEAVAFIVCRTIGLELGNASADYIQLYDGSPEVLTESLCHIQHASTAILAALESGAEDMELAEAC